MILSIVSTHRVGALATCLAGVLSACTNMSGLDGTAEYGCKAPQGVQCDSVSGNYYNAIQNNLPSQRHGRATDTETDKTRGSSRSASTPDARPPHLLPLAQPATDSPSPASAVALPLRSHARVLRLWFKPWEDADHDLYDQGFVYVQVDSGRWLIEHAQQRIRDAYAPIRPPRSAAASGASSLSTVAPSRPADPVFPGRRAETAPTHSEALAGAVGEPTSGRQ